MRNEDTIAAVATAPGVGGIAVVRVSGAEARTIVGRLWHGRQLDDMKSHTVRYGQITTIEGEPLDDVVLTYYQGPRSFTGEDTIEIACHGSSWIQRELILQLVRAGARPAEPGEFTQRAFINGRLDLAQAEGVADLISAGSRMAHRMAQRQANGQFSAHLGALREQLVEFASLLELELDFSEEEVEFADRERLRNLADEIMATLTRLKRSYATGKAFKEGIPVVIAGCPNAGKSTLLNQLLEEDRALVSDIPGTTRDTIEERCEIDGTLFRFIDTAGLRSTDDRVEQMGIERTEEKIRRAAIVLWVIDPTSDTAEQQRQEAQRWQRELPDVRFIILVNKSDLVATKETASEQEEKEQVEQEQGEKETGVAELHISAHRGDGVEELKRVMTKEIRQEFDPESDIMLTNARHYASIERAIESLGRAREALETQLSADFVAQDVRETLHHLGTLTGTITTPDLLASIFSHFCIGK